MVNRYELYQYSFNRKGQDTKHPEFPGLMMVPFTKDQGTYRRLATETVTAKPN